MKALAGGCLIVVITCPMWSVFIGAAFQKVRYLVYVGLADSPLIGPVWLCPHTPTGVLDSLVFCEAVESVPVCTAEEGQSVLPYGEACCFGQQAGVPGILSIWMVGFRASRGGSFSKPTSSLSSHRMGWLTYPGRRGKASKPRQECDGEQFLVIAWKWAKMRKWSPKGCSESVMSFFASEDESLRNSVRKP